MDPFSIVLGVGSLIQMSLELAKYLKDVYEAVASFEGDIESLLHEIQNIESVNKSIEHLHRTEVGPYAHDQPELSHQDLEVWQNTAKTLQDCSRTVQKLQHVLESITGKHGTKVTGWRDGIKKQLKKQSKDGEIKPLQQKLSIHRESLSVSLTLLNLIYTQRGSKDTQLFGFQLHKQIASLQSRLPLTETETLHDSLNSATAVASTLRLNKHFDTPKTVSSIYTGRQGYLDGLKQAFDSSHGTADDGSPHKRFVVYGLGGSGKTQFCCKFASDNKQRFWGVFTVDASSSGNAQQSFIAIAKACGTDPNERAAKSWLSSSDRPWLLLIDNADDTNLDIEKYFPDGEHGLTLITTRNPSVKMHGTIGRRYYHFDRLDDEEATELLLRAADHHEPRTSTIIQMASAITRKLGALPLALIHAGNAIKAKYCELQNYISHYDRSWQLIRQNQRLAGRGEDNVEYMKVYASYEIVFRGLEAIDLQRYRDAIQLLKLFSFLHHEHIPYSMLIAAIEHPRIQREADAQAIENSSKQGTNWQISSLRIRLRSVLDSFLKNQFENQNPIIMPTFLRDAELASPSEDSNVRLREALHLLTQLSLVTYYEGSDSYSMHPVVHTWVRERPRQRTLQDQAVWCEAALHTLSRSVLLPPLNETIRDHVELTRKLLPHIISVANLRQRIEHEFAINRQRRNRPWPALQTSISPWRALFLAKSGLVHSDCGNFVETEACIRAVVAFNQRFLGPNHPRTERARLIVSDCLWHQCRVNEAADLQEQVLSDNLKSLGPDHPRTLRLMDKLGESRRQQGRFSESLELLTKAREGLERQLPVDDPARYYVLEHLGTTLRVCYRFAEAREYHERAAAGMKLYLGETDPRTLVAIEESAITYKELGSLLKSSDNRTAQKCLEDAHSYAVFVFEQRKKQLGDRQPHTWMAQGTIGRIKAVMGDVAEAERIFSTILPVAMRHLGDEHLAVISHKNHHAKILIQQERYDEAESLLLDVIRPVIWKPATFTGDHPDRWDALWTLVNLYQKQGRISLSLEVCHELLKAVKTIRQGKAQTETSSTFWAMILTKRIELMSNQDPSLSGTDITAALIPQIDDSEPVDMSRMSVGSTGTQIDPFLSAPTLRPRHTTW